MEEVVGFDFFVVVNECGLVGGGNLWVEIF